MPVKGKVINTRRLGWAIIIGALTLEFAVRAFSFWGLNRPFWDDRKYLPDREIIWKLHPGYRGVWAPLFRHLEVNRQGLVGPEISRPKGPNVLRIILIGGSVTFGYGTPHPDSTCRGLVQDLLQKRNDGMRYEVLNAGAPGYSSYNGLQFARHKLQDLDADIFIMAFGGNDGAFDTAPDKDPNKDWSISDVSIRGATSYSYIIKFAQAISDDLRRKYIPHRENPLRSDYPLRVPLNDFYDNHAEMVARCRDLGVKPLLLREGQPHGVADDRTGKIAKHKGYLDVIKQVAAELQVPLADADSVFALYPTAETFPNHGEQFFYPSMKGQHWMAQIIVDTMEEAGYIPKK